jgi:hypothetical protein
VIYLQALYHKFSGDAGDARSSANHADVLCLATVKKPLYNGQVAADARMHECIAANVILPAHYIRQNRNCWVTMPCDLHCDTATKALPETIVDSKG